MDFDKLEALWKEIRESEYIAEKQLQDLQELIKALQALQAKYNKMDHDFNKNTKLLTTILEKSDLISKNLEGMETQTNTNLQNLQQELKNTIENITKQLRDDLEHILQKLRSDINAQRSDLDGLIDTYIDFSRKAKEFWDRQAELTETELNNLQKQIKTKTQEIFEELKQKSFLQKWGAVAGVFAAGIAVSFIYLIPAIKTKTQLSKVVQVVKIKDPQAQGIIANLNNKIVSLEQQIKELKSKNEELAKWQIPQKYRYNNNEFWFIGIPADDIETVGGQDYCFTKLFKK